MKDGALQLALREWRQDMSRPTTLVAMLAVAAVIAIMGPFETDEAMRMLPRFGYWLVLVVACYAWGAWVDTALRATLGTRKIVTKVLLSGAFTGIGVVAIVMSVNLLALDFVPERGRLLEFFATVFAIAVIVSGAFTLIARARSVDVVPDAMQEMPEMPPILDRLQFDKRGSLVALSVEDHYVRIQTVNGEELILMRLSDAIREVGATRGAQVHRSHWAAFDAVQSVRREGDRAILTMSHGQDVPVSRANMQKLREAGLLPERTC